MATPSEEDIVKRENEIRQKRIATLCGAYFLLGEKYRGIKEGTFLHDELVATTVENYLKDRRALCARHNINGRIQRHKIAGLMAGAIVKTKPIQINTTRSELGHDNEKFAAYHGLAICAENEPAKLGELMALEHFRQWMDDLVHLFVRQPSHTESFILAFESISLTYFPKNLKVED